MASVYAHLVALRPQCWTAVCKNFGLPGVMSARLLEGYCVDGAAPGDKENAHHILLACLLCSSKKHAVLSMT